MLKRIIHKICGNKKQKAQKLPDHGWMIRAIEIPDGAEKIEAREFEDMAPLESLVVPSSIQYIGSEAFRNTPNLHSLIYHSIIEDWWTYVEKAADWREGSSLKVVSCMDGDIVLDLPINF